MPLQSWELINSGDDCLRRAAEANGGDGVFQPVEMKVGWYCYSQNYFGDKAGIVQDIQPSQEISDACLALQSAMD